MKNFILKIFNNGKNYILPIVFCAINVAIIALVFVPSFIPAFQSVMQNDAFSKGTLLPMFDKAPTIMSETVDINEYGGMPEAGQEIGEIRIENTAVSCPVYFADGAQELHKGAGIHQLTYVPGQGGTIFMGGHTATWFADLGTAKIGDKVFIDTFYGKYEYEIVDTKIANESDTSAYPIVDDEEKLILYTCYPFGILEITQERYFVYADLVSGPIISNKEGAK